MFEFALFLVFPAVMALAGSIDLFTMTIPNRITLGLVIAFVLALPFSGLGWMAIASHVGAFALMLVIGILMFARGWFGGGDAKLMAAAALWIGLDRLFEYVIMISITGGVLVLAILAYRQATLPRCLLGQEWALRLHQKSGGVPYGIALAAAALWIYPKTSWFAQLAV